MLEWYAGRGGLLMLPDKAGPSNGPASSREKEATPEIAASCCRVNLVLHM